MNSAPIFSADTPWRTIEAALELVYGESLEHCTKGQLRTYYAIVNQIILWSDRHPEIKDTGLQHAPQLLFRINSLL